MIAGISLTSPEKLDTLIRRVPDRGYLVGNGHDGYAWITRTGMPDSLLAGSGYVVRRPSHRKGSAECGVRYSMRDLPKGSYRIVNWVVFPKPMVQPTETDFLRLLEPAQVTADGRAAPNLFSVQD